MSSRVVRKMTTAALTFVSASSFAAEGARITSHPEPVSRATVAGYAECRGAMPIMSMMAMMGPVLFGQHTRSCLAFMRSILKVGPSQTREWSEFSDSIQANVRTMTDMYESMMLLDDPNTTMSQRLSVEEKTMTSHFASLKRIEMAVGRLYAVLDETQKAESRKFYWFNDYFRQ